MRGFREKKRGLFMIRREKQRSAESFQLFCRGMKSHRVYMWWGFKKGLNKEP